MGIIIVNVCIISILYVEDNQKWRKWQQRFISVYKLNMRNYTKRDVTFWHFSQNVISSLMYITTTNKQIVWLAAVERWKRLLKKNWQVTKVPFQIQTKDILDTRLASEPRGRLGASLWRLHLAWRPFLQGKTGAVYQKDKSDAVVETYFDKWNMHVKVLRWLGVFTDGIFVFQIGVETENWFLFALA